MSKITSVSYKRVGRVFELKGFSLARQKGSHLIYTKEGIPRPLVIPMYDNVPVFVIRNLIRSSKNSRERYLQLLGEG